MSSEEEQQQSPQDLLALLEAQCASATGLAPTAAKETSPEASSSKRKLDQREEPDSDQDEAPEYDSEDISEEHSEAEQQPDVLEFAEPGRERRLAGNAGYKQFMSSNVSKMLDKNPKQQSRAKQQDSDSSDEEDMKHLDATLQKLISTIPESEASQASHSGFKPINHTIQKNTPLPLRRALQKSRLNRAKTQDQQAKEAQLLRPKGGGSSSSGNEPALTKREQRERDGTEAKRKKNAKGISGVVGQMVGGATTLRLDKRQIDAINSGRGPEVPSKQHSARSGSGGAGKNKKRRK